MIVDGALDLLKRHDGDRLASEKSGAPRHTAITLIHTFIPDTLRFVLRHTPDMSSLVHIQLGGLTGIVAKYFGPFASILCEYDLVLKRARNYVVIVYHEIAIMFAHQNL